MKTAFICDSTLQLNEEFSSKYNVKIIPLEVRLDNEIYEDNVSIKPIEFYEEISKGIKPSTSQPSIGKVLEIYEELKNDGYDNIIAFTLSKNFSGTNNSFEKAAEMIDNINIKIIDTEQVSRIAGHAIEKIIVDFYEEKVDISEIENYYFELRDKQNILVVIDGMEYLYTGGRINKAQLTISNLLSIVPILTLKNGSIHVEDKHRTLKKSLRKMCEAIKRKNPKSLVILHSINHELLEKVEDLINELFDSIEVEKVIVSPVLGAHTGPNVIAVGYYQY